MALFVRMTALESEPKAAQSWLWDGLVLKK